MSRDRQQRANVKARKAKARAIAAKQHRSWIDRKRQARHPNTTVSTTSMVAAATRMFQRPTAAEMDKAERLLCRLFGEEYRP